MKEVIDKFLNYLVVEKGFSENTKLAYENDLHQLAIFVEEEAARHGTIPPGLPLPASPCSATSLSLRSENTLPPP